MEVKMVNSATAQAIIKHLRAIFARFGLPEVVVTDNGTCFTSGKFQEFTQQNNIRHVRIALYYPSFIGLKETVNRVFADKTVTFPLSLQDNIKCYHWYSPS